MTSQVAGTWRCAVCGYVHHGSAPPEACPVCGASPSEFEAYQEEASRPAEHTVGRWRCMVCGYIHSGSVPPKDCPACGASPDQFEPITEAADEVVAAGPAAKIVVVGAGIAGLAAVESLRAASAEARVTLVSAEAHLPYYRLNLTRYMAGEVAAEALPIHPQDWYEEQNVELLLGRTVAGLKLDPQSIALEDGRELPFDKLVLASGASPMIPPIPGVPRENALCVRTVDDADFILSQARPGVRCVCIGGGILGLETAGALARRGADVALIENHGWLLPRQLNERAGRILERHVAGVGIRLHHRGRVAEVVGDRLAHGVRLDGGPTLPADLVIVATGIRSNVELARSAGLKVNRGVVVDDHLASSHPNVLAAGDVAEHRGTVYGIWVASQFQGNIAGLNAAGRHTQFAGIPRSNSLKVLGMELFSIGVVEGEGEGVEVVDQEHDGQYLRFVFSNNRLVGAIMLGDTVATASVKKAIESTTDLGHVLRKKPKADDILAELSSSHS